MEGRNALAIVVGAVIVVWLSGCSATVEFGYHGQTGRDNRTQTYVAPSGKRIIKEANTGY